MDPAFLVHRGDTPLFSLSQAPIQTIKPVFVAELRRARSYRAHLAAHGTGAALDHEAFACAVRERPEPEQALIRR
eukprot:1063114-Alexandrium_andersonii.AAC.1